MVAEVQFLNALKEDGITSPEMKNVRETGLFPSLLSPVSVKSMIYSLRQCPLLANICEVYIIFDSVILKCVS